MRLTCVVCPVGCEMTASVEDGRVVSVTGNACKRGIAYAREECLNPVRTLTTTVRDERGGLVPVKSARPLPKGRLMEFMGIIKAARVVGTARLGDVIIADIGGTGIDIVAAGENLRR